MFTALSRVLANVRASRKLSWLAAIAASVLCLEIQSLASAWWTCHGGRVQTLVCDHAELSLGAAMFVLWSTAIVALLFWLLIMPPTLWLTRYVHATLAAAIVVLVATFASALYQNYPPGQELFLIQLRRDLLQAPLIWLAAVLAAWFRPVPMARPAGT